METVNRELTRKEAATLLGCSVRTVDRLVKRNVLQKHRRAAGTPRVFLLLPEVKQAMSISNDCENMQQAV